MAYEPNGKALTQDIVIRHPSRNNLSQKKCDTIRRRKKWKRKGKQMSNTFNQFYSPLPSSHALAIYSDRFVIEGVPQPLPRIAPISSKFR